jgi:hypothetical protein
MKSPTSHQIKPFLSRALMPALLATAILTFGTATPGRADDNSRVFPPQSHPYGESYGEWVVDWWQWALSIPADRSPLTDSTGEFAGEGQRGLVWFVAGTFGDSVERTYKVPAGKALFVPVFNWIFGAGAFDCDPSNPGVPCVVCDLEKLAAANTEVADVLEAFIDGVAVQNIRRYEASSPGPFAIRYPENSVVGLPAGRYFPMVADGYWLMLKPLAQGTHEIRIHAHYPGLTYDPYEYTIVLHIEVTAPSHGGRGDDGDCDRN